VSRENLLTIHTDGAARGNPGPAAYAYTIERDGEDEIAEADVLGEVTNNQAEYTALVKALEHAAELGSDARVVVHSDSELMVKQLNGEYRVKNEDLRPLYEEAKRLIRHFPHGVTFRHVRREQNRRADQLCNEALDGLRVSTRLETPRRPPSALPVQEKKKRQGVRDEALAILRAAGVDSPEKVWKELVGLLREHWLGELD
jgi:ribonuclease HI